MRYNIDLFKGHLLEYVNAVTNRSKGKYYECPLCKSGQREHKTGAFLIRGDRWKCYACGQNGDIIDLYAAVNGCETREAMDGLARMFSIAPEDTSPEPTKKPAIRTDTAGQTGKSTPVVSYRADIDRWAAALPGSDGERYLQGRGLTSETMARYHLGTDGRYIIIPYNSDGTYYGRRAINDGAIKHNNLKGIKTPLYNAEALYRADICFVVESPLCAISVEQCGQPAVAISGTAGGYRLMDQLKARPAPCTLMLCLDNDKAGRTATEQLAAALEAAGYKYVSATDAILGTEESDKPGNYKDPNEELQRDPEELRERLQIAADDCRRIIAAETAKEAEARAAAAGPDAIDAFLDIVQTERYKPLPTGIRDIDRAIGGGLIRQQLVLLGAAPGAGKTALAQWVFETMAADGTADILYLNLEMSREQMIARSLSRIAKRHGLKITTTEALQGYKWTLDQRATVISAAEYFKTMIAPHMAYNPDGTTADLDTIISYIEAEAARAEIAGKDAPICIIDYLQIVRGEPREDAIDTIKRAVNAFKSYAIEHNSIVFVIMATNRDSNRNGDVTMESGRDTSALEYSADLQLGLAYTRCLERPGQTKKRRDELEPEDRPYRTLRITKGRFGGEGTEVDLYFDGESMTFLQIAKCSE